MISAVVVIAVCITAYSIFLKFDSGAHRKIMPWSVMASKYKISSSEDNYYNTISDPCGKYMVVRAKDGENGCKVALEIKSGHFTSEYPDDWEVIRETISTTSRCGVVMITECPSGHAIVRMKSVRQPRYNLQRLLIDSVTREPDLRYAIVQLDAEQDRKKEAA